jgi:hypothetical protein
VLALPVAPSRLDRIHFGPTEGPEVRIRLPPARRVCELLVPIAAKRQLISEEDRRSASARLREKPPKPDPISVSRPCCCPSAAGASGSGPRRSYRSKPRLLGREREWRRAGETLEAHAGLVQGRTSDTKPTPILPAGGQGDVIIGELGRSSVELSGPWISSHRKRVRKASQRFPQGIRKPVRRRKDARLLTGGGRFAYETNLGYACMVPSPHAMR